MVDAVDVPAQNTPLIAMQKDAKWELNTQI